MKNTPGTGKLVQALLLITAFCTLQALRCRQAPGISRAKLSASIHPICQMTENLRGTSVKTEYQSSGNYVGYMLVYGQSNASPTKELGVYIPWRPPARTEYILPHPDVTLYYDPNTNANGDSDQYGAISGSVWIGDVKISGSVIDTIFLTFTDVEISNGGSEKLCLNGEMFIAK